MGMDFKQLAKERLANGSSAVNQNKLDSTVFDYLKSVSDISSVYQLMTYLKSKGFEVTQSQIEKIRGVLVINSKVLSRRVFPTSIDYVASDMVSKYDEHRGTFSVEKKLYRTIDVLSLFTAYQDGKVVICNEEIEKIFAKLFTDEDKRVLSTRRILQELLVQRGVLTFNFRTIKEVTIPRTVLMYSSRRNNIYIFNIELSKNNIEDFLKNMDSIKEINYQ